MRILWLGSVFDENTMINSPAVSPAANRWQSGLIEALREIGCDVQMLGHRPEPVWPRGNFYVQGCTGNAPLINHNLRTPQHLISYFNIYRFQDFYLKLQYSNIFRRNLLFNVPQCILSYNVYPHSYAVGREAMRRGIPWIPIVADAPGEPQAYRQLEQKLSIAAGVIFLSWYSFINWSGGPKIHLDGGVNTIPSKEIELPSSEKPKIIFYSGSLNQYGGIDLLLDAFNKIDNADARLWICGKGDHKKMQQALKTDDRITFYGCVDELTLAQLSRQAWVMVNPRPNAVIDSKHNFPSKILEYLSYGKPVISTWTLGLSPEYRHVLYIPDEETAEGLSDIIQKIFQWSDHQYRENAIAVFSFLKQKTWVEQAKRLNTWISLEIASHR
ncbi:MAG: glycosyltransferase [Candidatus Methylumidiphilus sp.]